MARVPVRMDLSIKNQSPEGDAERRMRQQVIASSIVGNLLEWSVLRHMLVALQCNSTLFKAYIAYLSEKSGGV